MRIDDLKQKLARAEAAREEAVSAITDEEREEIELRNAIARADEERKAAELARRELELDRWEEEARALHGPDAKIATIMIDGYDDSFVVKHSSKDFKKWEQGVNKSFVDKKFDRDKNARDYAVASVICWNGATDFSLSSQSGGELVAHLTRNPGIVTSITSAAAKLAGAFTEARKS